MLTGPGGSHKGSCYPPTGFRLMCCLHFIMRSICLGFFLVAGWVCLFALRASAGEYKYPATLPALTINLPDRWKISEVPGAGRLIVCTGPTDANFVVSLMTLPVNTTLEQRDGILTRAARGAAESAKLTDVTVSAVSEEKINGGERTFAIVRATGKLKGSAATVFYGAFTLNEGGNYYLLGEAGPNASVQAHKEEFERAANSIQPYELATPAPTPMLRLAMPTPGGH